MLELLRLHHDPCLPRASAAVPSFHFIDQRNTMHQGGPIRRWYSPPLEIYPSRSVVHNSTMHRPSRIHHLRLWNAQRNKVPMLIKLALALSLIIGMATCGVRSASKDSGHRPAKHHRSHPRATTAPSVLVPTMSPDVPSDLPPPSPVVSPATKPTPKKKWSRIPPGFDEAPAKQ